MRTKFSLLLLAVFISAQAVAQIPVQRIDGDTAKEKTSDDDDLLAILEDEAPAEDKVEYTTATFKTTRLVNGHSIENTAKGVLDFRVSHRFGAVNQGIKDFFGLDNASTRIGFDYGVTDWLMVGIGRSSFQKEYDGFVKAKILRQRESGGMPVSVSYLGAMSIQTMDAPANLPPGTEYHFSNRVYYANQLLIARKFNQWLSLQLMPTHVHYNLVPKTSDPNDVLALGIGGRLKLSNRMSLNVEYYYRIPDYRIDGFNNSLSVGLDIETGGHVFQLMFTNSTGITERTMVGQTTDSWTDGGIHFGFNISRVFTIVKPKGFENSRNKIW